MITNRYWLSFLLAEKSWRGIKKSNNKRRIEEKVFRKM